MRRRVWLAMGLFCGSSAALEQQQHCVVQTDGSSTCSSSSETTTTTTTPEPVQCGLYLAPSTIPGAGLGIFTGVERNEGDSLGDGDLLLPIADVWWHLQASKDYNNYDEAPNTLNPTTDYVWRKLAY